MAKKPTARLADFQFAAADREARNRASTRRARFDLAASIPPPSRSRAATRRATRPPSTALALELDALQDLLYADRRFKLLVVLQGTDTSGKDGTIRGVFGQMSALGVHTVGWKAPTEEERAHDYLWRIHQQVPARGRDR